MEKLSSDLSVEDQEKLKKHALEMDEREAESAVTIRQLIDKIKELESMNECLQVNERHPESSSIELQCLQDELIACKLREAESNLSMKELQHRVNLLEKYWQQFLEEMRPGVVTEAAEKSKSPSPNDLKDMVMALRLRETRLISDLSEDKQKLMELETQNHIYERQIKRQEAERAGLDERMQVAETREKELLNTIAALEHKVADLENKGKEDLVMIKIQGAEHSHVMAEMRRRLAELEIENQELMTSAKLHDKDEDLKELETRVAELQEELAQSKMSHPEDDDLASMVDLSGMSVSAMEASFMRDMRCSSPVDGLLLAPDLVCSTIANSPSRQLQDDPDLEDDLHLDNGPIVANVPVDLES